MAIKRDVMGVFTRSKQFPLIVKIGALGAVSLANACGGVSVSKVATGEIKVQLDQAYPRLLACDVKILIPSAGAPSAPDVAVVDPANITADGSLLIWTALNAAPTVAANLASGAQISLIITVSETDAN